MLGSVPQEQQLIHLVSTKPQRVMLLGVGGTCLDRLTARSVVCNWLDWLGVQCMAGKIVRLVGAIMDAAGDIQDSS